MLAVARPKTPEGKRKSSQNAVRHGLLSKIVATQSESHRGFDLVFGDHFNTFKLANGVHRSCGRAQWRLRCLWAPENKMMNDAIQAVDSPDELTLLIAAYTQLVESPRYTLLHHYATSIDRNLPARPPQPAPSAS